VIWISVVALWVATAAFTWALAAAAARGDRGSPTEPEARPTPAPADERFSRGGTPTRPRARAPQ
jgi:hypothetical protein